jgi:hypothetical protein
MMRSTAFYLTALLATSGLTACDTTLETLPEDAPASSQAAVTSFQFDSKDLALRPTGGLPAERLPLSSFSQGHIAATLIGTQEVFQEVRFVDGRRYLESPTWHLEVDQLRGSVTVLRKVPGGQPAPQDESLLRSKALQRVQLWGIGSGELGPAHQRRLMKQDDNNGDPGPLLLARYKTFILRTISGIPVEGHRAVVTHHLDGSFHRAYISWPALSASGHLLHSQLDIPTIEQRAAAALGAEGESSGLVKLRWKYVPTQLSNGEVALTLKVSARLGQETQLDTTTEEPREVLVDVDALP